jgi:hypothetical protein
MELLLELEAMEDVVAVVHPMVVVQEVKASAVVLVDLEVVARVEAVWAVLEIQQ